MADLDGGRAAKAVVEDDGIALMVGLIHRRGEIGARGQPGPAIGEGVGGIGGRDAPGAGDFHIAGGHLAIVEGGGDRRPAREGVGVVADLDGGRAAKAVVESDGIALMVGLVHRRGEIGARGQPSPSIGEGVGSGRRGRIVGVGDSRIEAKGIAAMGKLRPVAFAVKGDGIFRHGDAAVAAVCAVEEGGLFRGDVLKVGYCHSTGKRAHKGRLFVLGQAVFGPDHEIISLEGCHKRAVYTGKTAGVFCRYNGDVVGINRNRGCSGCRCAGRVILKRRFCDGVGDLPVTRHAGQVVPGVGPVVVSRERDDRAVVLTVGLELHAHAGRQIGVFAMLPDLGYREAGLERVLIAVEHLDHVVFLIRNHIGDGANLLTGLIAGGLEVGQPVSRERDLVVDFGGLAVALFAELVCGGDGVFVVFHRHSQIGRGGLAVLQREFIHAAAVIRAGVFGEDVDHEGVAGLGRGIVFKEACADVVPVGFGVPAVAVRHKIVKGLVDGPVFCFVRRPVILPFRDISAVCRFRQVAQGVFGSTVAGEKHQIVEVVVVGDL